MEVWRNDLNDMPTGLVWDTPIDTGPATFVALVHGLLATGQTLRVRVMCNTNFVQDSTKWYVIEDVTMDAETGADLHAGFQSTPIPLVDDTWRFRVRVELAGGVSALVMYEVLKL